LRGLGRKHGGHKAAGIDDVGGDVISQFQCDFRHGYFLPFFAGLRTGNPLNNGVYMARSTMLAIMGRMASYTGQTLTWDQCLNSTEDLTPAKYEWADVAVPPVAKPGLTRFV